MYRYSQHVREGMGVSRTQRRFLSILCIILAVAVVVLGIMAARSMAFRSEYDSLLEKRLLNEANLAKSQFGSLSRTGGSYSSSVLGKIRQHVYAIKVLEETQGSLNGQQSREVDEVFFTQFFTILDSFESKLQTGQSSTEEQQALLEHLDYLIEVLQ